MTPLLIHRPKSVDRAFERLYKRHVHDVYRYTLAVLHNEADAEDVTQSTFLSAYRAFRKGERPVKPHNWLIKIAHNECRQRFRASARRPQEVALQETDGHSRPGLDEDVPSAEEIRHALAQLSFNQRAALVMRELEGRSYAEIATILETSVSAVETLLFRARRALREQLEGSLTCGQAELTLARRLEGSIAQTERGALRAHLRECKECASLERRQRAHRTALKTDPRRCPAAGLAPELLRRRRGDRRRRRGRRHGSRRQGRRRRGRRGRRRRSRPRGRSGGRVEAQQRKGETVLTTRGPGDAEFSPVARVERAAPVKRRPAQTRKASRGAVSAPIRQDRGAPAHASPLRARARPAPAGLRPTADPRSAPAAGAAPAAAGGRRRPRCRAGRAAGQAATPARRATAAAAATATAAAGRAAEAAGASTSSAPTAAAAAAAATAVTDSEVVRI